MNDQILTLRPLRPDDQQQFLEMLTSPLVNKTYMLPDYEKCEDAIPLFQRLQNLSYESCRFVRCISLNDTAIGFLNDVEIKDGTIELGYVIHPNFHNRGFMTAALTLAIRELFANGYDNVICGAFEENKASIRVMEKAGMARIEHTDTVEYRGKTHNCIYYHAQH